MGHEPSTAALLMDPERNDAIRICWMYGLIPERLGTQVRRTICLLRREGKWLQCGAAAPCKR
jgi:hypothetical protein